jgi:myosin heavy subunit
MEVGASVWLRDSIEAWVSGKITSKTESKGIHQISIVKDTTKEEVRFELKADVQENDDFKLMNHVDESESNDLITLPYLNEPSIVYCLQKRYKDNNIYTYTGPILIALNPFKVVEIYDQVVF